MNIQEDLYNLDKWKKTSKKNYEVYVCRMPLNSRVVNRLDGASYITTKDRPYVISGTQGERYVIGADELRSTYTYLDGSEIIPDNLRSEIVALNSENCNDWVKIRTRTGIKNAINWAFHVPTDVVNLPVHTYYGDTMYANRQEPGINHGNGDFLVCTDAGGQPNMNNMWVVNGLVFESTYDMRAFPGLSTGYTNDSIPKPISLRSIVGLTDKKNDKIVIRDGRVKVNRNITGDVTEENKFEQEFNRQEEKHDKIGAKISDIAGRAMFSKLTDIDESVSVNKLQNNRTRKSKDGTENERVCVFIVKSNNTDIELGVINVFSSTDKDMNTLENPKLKIKLQARRGTTKLYEHEGLIDVPLSGNYSAVVSDIASRFADELRIYTYTPQALSGRSNEITGLYNNYSSKICKGIADKFWSRWNGAKPVERQLNTKANRRTINGGELGPYSSYVNTVITEIKKPDYVALRLRLRFIIPDNDINIENPWVEINFGLETISEKCSYQCRVRNRYRDINDSSCAGYIQEFMSYLEANKNSFDKLNRVKEREHGVETVHISGHEISKVVLDPDYMGGTSVLGAMKGAFKRFSR